MAFAFGGLTPHRTNIIVGVTIVIGAIGGIYLLQRGAKLVSQITEKKAKKKPDDICNICFNKLEVEDFKSCVTCCNCQKFVCRGRQCSIWLPSQAGWECHLCSLSSESHSRASEWLHQQISDKFLQPMSVRSDRSLPTKENQNDYDTLSETPSSYCSEQREKIREFVEDTLSNMLGGSLDNISVGQMYKSREYLPLWESEDLPGVSHVKLKRLIEKIIHETLRLPTLFDYSGVSAQPEESLPFFDPKKYQELLATAVLNKIVDSYNYEKKFENHSEPPNNNADLDKNHNPVVSTKEQNVSQSSSSIEPGSDSSITDPTINIPRRDDAYQSDTDSNLQSDITTRSVHTGDESVLSDYIAKHKVPLPELTLDSESPDDDFISVTTSQTIEGNWEDNWLFKKKKRGNEASGSVGMLVPSPREDIKTLIGDKTADEVSDLSEGSDFEDTESSENKTPTDTDLPNVLVQSKNVIGGKSTVGLFDELLEQTSLISTTSIQDGETAFTECKNDFVLNDDGLNDPEVPKLNLINNNKNIIIQSEAVNSLIKTDLLTKDSVRSNEVGVIEHNDEDFEAIIIAPPEHFTDDEISSLECTTNSISEFQSLDTIEGIVEKMETVVVATESVQPSEDPSANFDSSNQVDNTPSKVTTDECSTTAEKPLIDPQPIEAQNLPSSIEITTVLHKAPSHSTNTPPTQSEHDAQNQALEDNDNLTNFTNITNNNGQKHLKLEALKNSTFSKQLTPAENAEELLGHFLPGSIAERERLKWYQAVDMPNNPYSAEALKHRLSVGGSEKPIDIPNIKANLDLSSSEDKLNTLDQEVGEGNKSLQIVIGDNKPDFKRYGRDYYINDAKHACGTRRRIESATEPLLPLLPSTEDDRHSENKVKQSATESNTNSSISPVQRSSSCSEKRSAESCDIFSARPVRVEESDPILNKAIKLEYLSTPERDFYLLPNEEIENLKSSTQSDNSSLVSQNTDSLTASEDSDTIRVYDLKKQETRIIKDEKVVETVLPETTVTTPKSRPNILSFTAKPVQHQQQQLQQQQQQQTRKVTTPTALKFLQPKRKAFDPHRIMSVDSGLKSPLFENNNIMSAPSIDSADKLVIEEELISALPSVKALAKAFSLNSPDNLSPAFKPRPPLNYSLDIKAQRIVEETHDTISVREPSSDSYEPPYNQTYSPLQTSVTIETSANGLPAKIEPIETLIEVMETQEVNEAIEQQQKEEQEVEVVVEEHKHEIIVEESIPKEKSSVPERPISPVLVPGLLKNNIAFFENLKNK